MFGFERLSQEDLRIIAAAQGAAAQARAQQQRLNARMVTAGDVWRRAGYDELAETAEAVMAHDLGLVTDEDRAGLPPWVDVRVAYRRTRERWATDRLRAGIASGRLPDWPAWSDLMAEVPL